MNIKRVVLLLTVIAIAFGMVALLAMPDQSAGGLARYGNGTTQGSSQGQGPNWPGDPGQAVARYGNGTTQGNAQGQGPNWPGSPG
jgi:hypothetical protein